MTTTPPASEATRPPRVGVRLREFFGRESGATFFWTRWLVVRAVGVVYLFVFAGIIVEGQAILAPNGIAQLGELLEQARRTFPGGLARIAHVPSLFWLSQSPAMIATLAWAGLAAALAVVLNVWPRVMLALCWGLFLSFASVWRSFSPAQLDGLMLETALLCIPFAPAGRRPGLGLSSPPRPIALAMMRWLLLRVMLENGLVKFASGDPHWRNGSAMEALYETSPFPTILGFFAHQLPRAWHLGEIALTFFAELVAPVIAVFGGRRERWISFGAWLVLQVGIQVTCNFGWLNAAAIGLGVLLLDDRMLAAAAEKLRLRRIGEKLTAGVASAGVATPAVTGWRLYGLRAALWAHFYVTLVYFTRACGVAPGTLPALVAWPAEATKEFHSANGYYLYATFEPVRFQVEFEGSNDGGRTWRAYPFRHIPQRTDRVSGFVAPWFLRFEATMEIEGWSGRKSPVFSAVAAHLLAGNPNVIALFERDPFPDKAPALVRLRGYRMAFADWAEWRRTGNFWRREPDGEYAPMLRRTESGEIEQVTLAEGNRALVANNPGGAVEIFSRHYAAGSADAGLRLAVLLARGQGVPADPAKAFRLYQALAKEGEVAAEHYLGAFCENGIGTAVDFAAAAKWYGRAAARGYYFSISNLGAMHVNNRVLPPDDVTGLALLLEAIEVAKTFHTPPQRAGESHDDLVARLKGRMSGAQIAEAERRVRERPPRRGLRP